MGRSRYNIYEEHYPYFITSTIKDGLLLLSNPKLATEVLNSFRFLQRDRKVLIYGYEIMEDHFHAIVKGEGLSKKLRLAKSFMPRWRDSRNYLFRKIAWQLNRRFRHAFRPGSLECV